MGKKSKRNRKKNAARRVQNGGEIVTQNVKNEQNLAEITEKNSENAINNDQWSAEIGVSEETRVEAELVPDSTQKQMEEVSTDVVVLDPESVDGKNETSTNVAEMDLKSADKEQTIKTELEQAEIEIDGAKAVRRKRVHPWIWWLLGLVAVVLMMVAGMAMWKALGDELLGGRDTDMTVEAPEEPELEEEKPEEEPSKEEPPKEEEPVKEDPTVPEQPIGERPQGTTEVPAVTPGSRVIALTFDDGPSAATTPRLLDILQGRGVKATFFVLGNLAERNPGIIQREAAEGHEVASHTPYHNQLTNLTYAQVRAEAVEMDRIFTEILGTVPPFTRPPYGAHNEVVRDALHQPLITWSIDPRDWADRNAAVVCNRVISAAFDGAIILVHDIHATTVDAVPCIIDNLRAQGYEFLTVSELAAAKNVPLVNGGVYGRF